MGLTTAQLDRACGVLLATAAGDALGAGYEFGPPLPADAAVEMKGGGSFGWAPGEWTDDTSMALAIAETAARSADLRTTQAQDAIVARWCTWSAQAKDIGIQTSRVLSAVRKGTAAEALAESRVLHESTGRTAGNGSLMRTAPVALAFLDDPGGLTEAAAAVSAITHFDPEAGEACVLWCHAIRHAVLTGALDIQAGLDRLPAASRGRWAERLTAAEHGRPRDFAAMNGWVVAALQAAWSAIVTTPVPEDVPAAGQFRASHLRLALENAVRGGKDTDTVAAIAGGLLGAVHGASAVPARWRLLLHGWPGLRAAGLIDLATAIAAGRPDKPLAYDGCRPPVTVPHPDDPGVVLGDIAALRALPEQVTAVVSLCRVGEQDRAAITAQTPTWLQVRLIDQDDPEENRNLDFVLDDTVSAIEELRAKGHVVFVHCVHAQSQAPAIGALYAMRRTGATPAAAIAAMTRAVPGARPNNAFRVALDRAARVQAETR